MKYLIYIPSYIIVFILMLILIIRIEHNEKYKILERMSTQYVDCLSKNKAKSCNNQLEVRELFTYNALVEKKVQKN